MNHYNMLFERFRETDAGNEETVMKLLAAKRRKRSPAAVKARQHRRRGFIIKQERVHRDEERIIRL